MFGVFGHKFKLIFSSAHSIDPFAMILEQKRSQCRNNHTEQASVNPRGLLDNRIRGTGNDFRSDVRCMSIGTMRTLMDAVSQTLCARMLSNESVRYGRIMICKWAVLRSMRPTHRPHLICRYGSTVKHCGTNVRWTQAPDRISGA